MVGLRQGTTRQARPPTTVQAPLHASSAWLYPEISWHNCGWSLCRNLKNGGLLK